MFASESSRRRLSIDIKELKRFMCGDDLLQVIQNNETNIFTNSQ